MAHVHTGRHALHRLRTYYRLEASLEEMKQLARDIHERRAETVFLKRLSQNRKHLQVKFKNTWIYVIYAPQLHQIVTVLHPNHETK